MRYDRQILMPEIGIEGQKKLERAVVTVIGCGGLGSPVLTYLAQAGVGTIRLVDGDIVSDTNLNRQFLYREEDIGKKKADLRGKVKENEPGDPRGGICLLSDRRKYRPDPERIGCCGGLCGQPCSQMYCREILPCRGYFPCGGSCAGVLRVCDGHFPETACLECLGYHLGKSPVPVPALGAQPG